MEEEDKATGFRGHPQLIVEISKESLGGLAVEHPRPPGVPRPLLSRPPSEPDALALRGLQHLLLGCPGLPSLGPLLSVVALVDLGGACCYKFIKIVGCSNFSGV